MGDGLALSAQIESLLFVADEPVSVGRLAEALEVTEGEVEQALRDVEENLQSRGLRLERVNTLIQMVTAPEAADVVERFLGLAGRRQLSPAALEALAIIAYRQPISRPEIEAIRGVNSDSVLRTLLRAGLIEDVGRAETVGRPYLYGTTFSFLQHFGLSGLDELPDLDLPPE
ncbi:MAG: SMC-Scp complex subunit ScpB [Anaerolineae bacterium]